MLAVFKEEGAIVMGWRVLQTVLSVAAMLAGLLHVMMSREVQEQLVGIAVMVFAGFAWNLGHWRDVSDEEQDIEF